MPSGQPHQEKATAPTKRARNTNKGGGTDGKHAPKQQTPHATAAREEKPTGRDSDRSTRHAARHRSTPHSTAARDRSTRTQHATAARHTRPQHATAHATAAPQYTEACKFNIMITMQSPMQTALLSPLGRGRR